MPNTRGWWSFPAIPRKPRDKPPAEDSVRLIYLRVFARLRNRAFFSLPELNAAIMEKLREHNQTRMQRGPVSRQERFLAMKNTCWEPFPKNTLKNGIMRNCR